MYFVLVVKTFELVVTGRAIHSTWYVSTTISLFISTAKAFLCEKIIKQWSNPDEPNNTYSMAVSMWHTHFLLKLPT